MIGEPVFAALAQNTTLVDAIGMLGFALAGILAAQGRGVDPVGVFILAFTSAFGGLTIRDLLLDLRPFYWVSHEAITWLILVFTIFAPAIVKRFSRSFAHELFLWADAVGLGVFCASGTLLAWEKGIPPLSCTLVGVGTGILGGVMRDVLLNRMPAALSDRKPYGLAGFVGCWLCVILLSDGVRPEATVYVTAATIVLFRMFTLKVNWEIRYRSELAKKIFPGNGPVSLARMLKRRRSAGENGNPAAPRPKELRREKVIRRDDSAREAPPRYSANVLPQRRDYSKEKPANKPSAGSSEKPRK